MNWHLLMNKKACTSDGWHTRTHCNYSVYLLILLVFDWFVEFIHQRRQLTQPRGFFPLLKVVGGTGFADPKEYAARLLQRHHGSDSFRRLSQKALEASFFFGGGTRIWEIYSMLMWHDKSTYISYMFLVYLISISLAMSKSIFISISKSISQHLYLYVDISIFLDIYIKGSERPSTGRREGWLQKMWSWN